MEDYLGHRSCQEPEPSQGGETDHVDLSHRPFQEILDNIRNLPDQPVRSDDDVGDHPPSEDDDYDGDVISAISTDDAKSRLPDARLYPTQHGGATNDPFASRYHQYSYRTLAFMYSLADNSWGVWKHSDSDHKRREPLHVYGEWITVEQDLGPMAMRIVALVEKPLRLSAEGPVLSTEDVMDAQRQAFAAIKDVMTKMIDTLESGIVKLEHDEVERYRVVNGEPVLHNEDGDSVETARQKADSAGKTFEDFTMSMLEGLFEAKVYYHSIDSL